MNAENDEFWKRTSDRAELAAARRGAERLYSRGWRRNVMALVLIAALLCVIWLVRR